MRSMTKVHYLKALQQQLYRLLNVYSELKVALESAYIINEQPSLLQELEQQLETIQTEIMFLQSRLQQLSTKVK